MTLVTLVGGMPANIAASYAALCCDDCDQGSECDDDHEQECDCPLGCDSCCVSSNVPAVVSPWATALSSPALASLRQGLAASERPPDGVSRDILKVPKSAA